MDKEQLKSVLLTSAKGALFAAAIRIAQQSLGEVKVGDQKLVLFTARK